MAKSVQSKLRAPRLIWIYGVAIDKALDSATWLQTTQALRNLGWDVTLIGKGPDGEQIYNGIQATNIATTERYFLNWVLFHLRLIRYLLTHWRTTDIILFHQLTALWVLPLRLLGVLLGGERPRFVMDTRDLNVVEPTLKNRLRTHFFALMHWWANRWADGQTAITPRMAQLVAIPAEQLWGLWPSGVSVERFASVHQGRHWPASGEPIHLMYVGKLHEERNLAPLAQAVEAAHKEGMSFALTYVGSGPEQGVLEQFAASTAGRVSVQPAVPHDQIPVLLRQAHVGVTSLPDPENEKFQASSPIKLFEYMAAGLPVLSTRNVCHSDVVGAGRYAFWADNAEVPRLLVALRQIWQAHQELAQLGEEARGAVNAWSWQAAGQQLDQALRRGLAHRVRNEEAVHVH
jgi:glycosyltransferase involved in cell wall biosynthesis